MGLEPAKKGDPVSCENYRPISFISAGYKLFAVALLNRLKDAGAESRLSSTQFGFRSQRGSSDAIFIARRLLEDAWSRKDGSLILMALAWAKAFDSISPTCLAMALERFGVPPSLIKIVVSIYSDRKFTVRDCGCTSNKYDQHHGIPQGCPLSPFLFSIVMTVLIADASYAVKDTLSNHLPKTIVNELMYADDTLLVILPLFARPTRCPTPRPRHPRLRSRPRQRLRHMRAARRPPHRLCQPRRHHVVWTGAPDTTQGDHAVADRHDDAPPLTDDVPAAETSQGGAGHSALAGIPAAAWSSLDAVDLAAEFGTPVPTMQSVPVHVLALWRFTRSPRSILTRHSPSANPSLETVPARAAPAAPPPSRTGHSRPESPVATFARLPCWTLGHSAHRRPHSRCRTTRWLRSRRR